MRRPDELTQRTIETLKTPGRHRDGKNLYLVIDANGSKRWSFLYRRNGKLREMGLGSLSNVTLATARRKAREWREVLGDGKDPIAVKKAAQAAEREAEAVLKRPTFAKCADDYILAHEGSWKNEKHRQQWAMTLKKYAEPLRGKRVDEIETADVLEMLNLHWSKRPETAARLRNRVELVLDAARAAGYRSGENPARWKGHLDKLLPKRQKLTRGHHAAVPYVEIPAFMAALRATPGTAARLLEFIVLTASRFSEAANATWREIGDDGVWTVPAARMKAGREHRVPLTDRALEILAEMREISTNELIFPGAKGGRPISSTGLAKIVQKLAGDATVHGFRSSFRDWSGDRTSFPREIAEGALAHVAGDKVEQAYRRSDALARRRELMVAWASYCGEPREGVVELNRRGA